MPREDNVNVRLALEVGGWTSRFITEELVIMFYSVKAEVFRSREVSQVVSSSHRCPVLINLSLLSMKLALHLEPIVPECSCSNTLTKHDYEIWLCEFDSFKQANFREWFVFETSKTFGTSHKCRRNCIIKSCCVIYNVTLGKVAAYHPDLLTFFTFH